MPKLVATLRASSGLDDDEMTAGSTLALQTFDEAAIFTIHGFCQRALADTPFAAQMPLALEVLQDDAEFVAEAANDFWRRRVAGDRSTPALAAYLVRAQGLAGEVRRACSRATSPSRWRRCGGRAKRQVARTADATLAALPAAHDAARALWQAGARRRSCRCVLDAPAAS